MSAYKPGFIQKLENAVSGSISPTSIEDYELLMAEDEVMMTIAGDNLYGLKSSIPLVLTFVNSP